MDAGLETVLEGIVRSGGSGKTSQHTINRDVQIYPVPSKWCQLFPSKIYRFPKSSPSMSIATSSFDVLDKAHLPEVVRHLEWLCRHTVDGSDLFPSGGGQLQFSIFEHQSESFFIQWQNLYTIGTRRSLRHDGNLFNFRRGAWRLRAPAARELCIIYYFYLYVS